MARLKEIAPRVAWLVSAVVGGVFVYAGAAKVLDPARFATSIFNYHLLPWPLCALLALYLPWLEIFCGGALIVKRPASGALFIITTLCVIFLGALLSAKVRGLNIECGCVGEGHSHSLTASILLDCALIAGLIFVMSVKAKPE